MHSYSNAYRIGQDWTIKMCFYSKYIFESLVWVLVREMSSQVIYVFLAKDAIYTWRRVLCVMLRLIVWGVPTQVLSRLYTGASLGCSYTNVYSTYVQKIQQPQNTCEICAMGDPCLFNVRDSMVLRTFVRRADLCTVAGSVWWVPRHKCPRFSLMCLDPGSGRQIPAIWHGARGNPGVFIPET